MISFAAKSKFVLFCLLLAIAKLILVAQSEIVSIQDDSAVYASQSLGRWVLGYPQGYPIWLILCRAFEFPQRIAIEILFLLAAYVVTAAILFLMR